MREGDSREGDGIKTFERPVDHRPHRNYEGPAQASAKSEVRVQEKAGLTRSMLTLFAIPQYFRERFATIWRSATLSWTRFTARPGILLFGDEEGTPEIASELGLRHLSEVARN